MTENLRIKALCRSCEKETNHKINYVEEETGEVPFEHHPEDMYWWNNKYQIIECLGCNKKSFRIENVNSEDHDFNEQFVNVNLYPEIDLNNLRTKYYFTAPVPISKIYFETIKAYNCDLDILCAAGLRALVEGICKAQSIKKGNISYTTKTGETKTKESDSLGGKINGLAEKGFLSANNSKALHGHKFLGNAALHSLEVPTKKELKLSIEIIENILDDLYEIPLKAKTLKRIRNK